MLVQNRSFVHGVQSINWQPILIMTVCLMGLHIVFFGSVRNTAPTNLESAPVLYEPEIIPVIGDVPILGEDFDAAVAAIAEQTDFTPDESVSNGPGSNENSEKAQGGPQFPAPLESVNSNQDLTLPTNPSKSAHELTPSKPGNGKGKVAEVANEQSKDMEEFVGEDQWEEEEGGEEEEYEEEDEEEEYVEYETEMDSDAEYVAICLAVKDQAPDLPEWFIHHYHHLGIKRFYVMDDGTDPPLSTVDIDYGIPSEAITFHYQERATRDQAMQTTFYQQCNEWWGSQHSWIAYIDVDEFLEVTSPHETLESILRGMDDDDMVGALGINWKLHTSNGHLKRQWSTRKSYTTCLWDSPFEQSEGKDDNHHIKSIAKTSKFLSPSNPHKMNLKDGAMTVNEHGALIDRYAWSSPISRDRIALHHYAVKSREEFEEKLQRSNAMTDPKDEHFWEYMETLVPQVNCTEMSQYHP